MTKSQILPQRINLELSQEPPNLIWTHSSRSTSPSAIPIPHPSSKFQTLPQREQLSAKPYAAFPSSSPQPPGYNTIPVSVRRFSTHTSKTFIHSTIRDFLTQTSYSTCALATTRHTCLSPVGKISEITIIAVISPT